MCPLESRPANGNRPKDRAEALRRFVYAAAGTPSCRRNYRWRTPSGVRLRKTDFAYEKIKIDGDCLLICLPKTVIFRWNGMASLQLHGNGFDLLFLMFCVLLSRRIDTFFACDAGGF